MKIALRNFLTTLRRYKASSLLNIVGLTLAFTACYIILVQVRWEMTYNRTLRDSEHIYLVESTDWYTPGAWQSWLCRPMVERFITSTSAVEVGGCTWGGFGPSVVLRENATKWVTTASTTSMRAPSRCRCSTSSTSSPWQVMSTI